MKKLKLNQVIPIVTARKSKSSEELTSIYVGVKKVDTITGLVKTYAPNTEGGEQLPSEEKRGSTTIKAELKRTSDITADLINIVAQQDIANTKAFADVVVDDVVVLTAVPATHLIYLEKQLLNTRNIIEALPVLSPEVNWTAQGDGTFKSEPVVTQRTKKEPRVITKAKATDKHPEQVEMIFEDRVVGLWTRVDISGAIKAENKNALLTRCNKLMDAVKAAREEANSIETETSDIGTKAMNFIFS